MGNPPPPPPPPKSSFPLKISPLKKKGEEKGEKKGGKEKEKRNKNGIVNDLLRHWIAAVF